MLSFSEQPEKATVTDPKMLKKLAFRAISTF
jgi:hypothetical protein